SSLDSDQGATATVNPNACGTARATTGAGQQRASRPSQIVDCPAGDAARRVERGLAFGEAAERSAAVHAENMVAPAQHRLRRDDALRRLRERDDGVALALAARGRDCPRRAVVRQLGATQ